MDVAVIGGDARFAYLAQMLRLRGLDARAIGLENAEVTGIVHTSPEELARANFLVLNSPVQMKLTEEKLELTDILRLAGRGARMIFAGPQPAPALEECFFTTYDLSQNEAFLCQNAYLTAEGAISAAMSRAEDCLADLNCLVIGWGRIGRALTELLVGMNVSVTVASRGEKGRRQAQERGAQALNTDQIMDALGGMQVIFSTPPAMVLNAEALARVEKSALIIDLASPPFGVDLQAAQRQGKNAWREPGLPGRYCPRSAARVLASCTMEIIKKEGRE